MSSFGWPAEVKNFCAAPWQPRQREFGYGLAILIGSRYVPVVYRQTCPRPSNSRLQSAAEPVVGMARVALVLLDVPVLEVGGCEGLALHVPEILDTKGVMT